MLCTPLLSVFWCQPHHHPIRAGPHLIRTLVLDNMRQKEARVWSRRVAAGDEFTKECASDGEDAVCLLAFIEGRVSETWQVGRETPRPPAQFCQTSRGLRRIRCATTEEIERRTETRWHRGVDPRARARVRVASARHWLMGCRRHEEHARWRRIP